MWCCSISPDDNPDSTQRRDRRTSSFGLGDPVEPRHTSRSVGWRVRGRACAVESDQSKWDPLRAEKDIEVGKYYMKKGDLDAAIDRFQDTTDAKPGYAIPFLYLAKLTRKKERRSRQ
jgi:hypothetical protein